MPRNHLHARLGCPVLAWTIVCLLVISLSGCGQVTPTPEPVTIRFVHFGVDPDYYQSLAQEFNASHPYITVELLDDADDADVFINSPFALSGLRDEVLSLDPFIEQDESFDRSDFYPGTVELFTREGETWAVPASVNVMVTYFNQDLFDQYNVPYPEAGWTLDDFLNRALALRDPEASVFGYAPIDPFLEALLFIYQHGGWIFDDLRNPTRTAFDDPLTVEALEWYVGLTNEHNVAPTQDQLYDKEFGQTMESGVYLGKVGMWIEWLSARGGGGGVESRWPGEWKMRWGMAPLPRDAQQAALAFANGYFMSSQTPYPDACWQWIAFLSGQIPRSAVPARRSLVESTAYEQLVGREVASVVRASMEDAALLSPRMVEFDQALGIFGQALNRIISGRSTPEEAMTQAQREAERTGP